MSVIFVGENHGDPNYVGQPLHHLPVSGSGGRLMRILGMSVKEYESYDKTNLCAGKWNETEARENAAKLVASEYYKGIVALGRKAALAFGLRVGPFELQGVWPTARPLFLYLPHPSGLSRTYNDPQKIEEARMAFLQFQTELRRVA